MAVQHNARQCHYHLQGVLQMLTLLSGVTEARPCLASSGPIMASHDCITWVYSSACVQAEEQGN